MPSSVCQALLATGEKKFSIPLMSSSRRWCPSCRSPREASKGRAGDEIAWRCLGKPRIEGRRCIPVGGVGLDSTLMSGYLALKAGMMGAGPDIGAHRRAPASRWWRVWAALAAWTLAVLGGDHQRRCCPAGSAASGRKSVLELLQSTLLYSCLGSCRIPGPPAFCEASDPRAMRGLPPRLVQQTVRSPASRPGALQAQRGERCTLSAERARVSAAASGGAAGDPPPAWRWRARAASRSRPEAPPSARHRHGRGGSSPRSSAD